MTTSHVEASPGDSLLAARERWVAHGVATPAIAAVRAQGAHIEGADGITYLAIKRVR